MTYVGFIDRCTAKNMLCLEDGKCFNTCIGDVFEVEGPVAPRYLARGTLGVLRESIAYPSLLGKLFLRLANGDLLSVEGGHVYTHTVSDLFEPVDACTLTVE